MPIQKHTLHSTELSAAAAAAAHADVQESLPYCMHLQLQELLMSQETLVQVLG
jgi:hypothetical protein